MSSVVWILQARPIHGDADSTGERPLQKCKFLFTELSTLNDGFVSMYFFNVFNSLNDLFAFLYWFFCVFQIVLAIFTLFGGVFDYF